MTSFAYLKSGERGSQVTRLYDERGALLSTESHGYTHDPYGRMSSAIANGAALAEYAYNANDQVAGVRFENGDSLTLSYDSLTRRQVGSSQSVAGVVASVFNTLNARGLIDTEVFSVDQSATVRRYDYSAQRFLVRAADDIDAYDYEYHRVGLPTAITKNGARTTSALNPAKAARDINPKTVDGLGRILKHGNVTFTYGPHGDIASATNGALTWSFLYDESGQRLMKLLGKSPVAAYLEQGYWDAQGLTQSVKVAGRTVGVLRGGRFTSVVTDARGTVFAENGRLNLASPYGDRASHPSTAAAIDYVEKGYDSDLGLVRMGVRDYAPSTSRFLTPDPLFLENPSACVESPQPCNLYGYAKNSPVIFADPSGREPTDASATDASSGGIFGWIENLLRNGLHRTCDVAERTEELRNAVSEGVDVLEYASQGTDLANMKNATALFEQAKGALEPLKELLDKTELVCKQGTAVEQIHDSLEALKDGELISRDPKRAVREIEKMLKGFATLAENLPPPANAYAKILEEAANGFISNFERGIIPACKPNSRDMWRFIGDGPWGQSTWGENKCSLDD